MLEDDIKKFREQIVLQQANAEALELQWEAKAFSECLDLLNVILKKNGLDK